MTAKSFVPRPYQEFAIEQIVKKPAVALMLDMGLGKTAVTLTAIDLLLYDYLEVKKVLVIAPKRVAESTWTDEIANWEHLNMLRASKVLGSEKNRIKALDTRAEIYIINRENVPWLVSYYKSRWPFDMVVIDESSSFKNPQAQRFKALKKVLPKINRIVELTGTPAPNGLLDLWPQIYLLDRGERLGRTISQYRREFFTPGAGNGYVTYEWKLNQGADKEIYNRISDICVSMKSEDYVSLPPVIYNRVPVKLPDAVLKRYKELEKEMVLELANTELVATSAATLSNKLLQLANGCVYDAEGESIELHTEKLTALGDLIGLNEHEHFLVFYWFKHDIEAIKKHFSYARELKTVNDIKNWNAGKIKMLLVHPASAGHGLNLQYGGNVVVWYGLTWSLELYQQANKRLHRSGQTKTVIIHHLIAQGTIDEDVMEALQDKDTRQSNMLEAVKARIRAYTGG